MDELNRELAQVTKSRASKRKWPADHLLRLVTEAAAADMNHPKGQGRNWNVVLATLVSVWRDESSKARAIDAHALRQRAEAMRRDRDGRRGPVDDEEWE